MQLDLRHQLQVYLGIWERETYAFVRKASKHSQWALDIGAGRGEYTLFLLNSPLMDKVVSVEPLGQAYDSIIQKNLELNKYEYDPRLVRLKKYLGLSLKPDYTTLDSIKVDLDKRGFIKLDVDGGELDVLRSGNKMLTEGRVSLLVETHSPELEVSCMKLLDEWGYDCSLIKNAWWRRLVPELRTIEHNRWFSAVKRDDQ